MKQKQILLIGFLFIGVVLVLTVSILQRTSVPEHNQGSITPSPSPITTPKIQESTKKFPSKATFKIQNIGLIKIKDYSKAELQSAIVRFSSQVIQPQVTSVSEYRLTFDYVNAHGRVTPVFTQVFIPEIETSPVFLFGSGTTGLANTCAPSRERVSVSNIGNYKNQMLAQASQGQVVIFPDYDGFHDEIMTHSYFIAEEEARVMLGSLEALDTQKQIASLPSEIDFQNIVISGYSQGGHAALATLDLAQKTYSHYGFVGMIGYASAQDVLALLEERPQLAPYLAYAYQNYYPDLNYDFTQILQPNWKNRLQQDVLRLCIDSVYSYYPQNREKIYTPSFVRSQENASLTTEFQVLYETFSSNIPNPKLEIPIILIQGSSDPIVTAQTQKQNLNRLCAADNQVYYHELQGVDHYQIRQTSFTQTQSYLNQLYDQSFTSNSCPSQ